jgi:hypothetical protein
VLGLIVRAVLDGLGLALDVAQTVVVLLLVVQLAPWRQESRLRSSYGLAAQAGTRVRGADRRGR